MFEIKPKSLIVFFVLGVFLCGGIYISENILEDKQMPEPKIVPTIGGNTTGSNEVRVVVCKNFGREEILSSMAYNLSEGDSAMDALQTVADVETAYDGKFINSINGLKSGHKEDWFYFINGISANVGAMDYILSGGDVERWDYHDWSYQLFIPAVIGDYPEPFRHGTEGNVLPTIIVYDREFEDDSHNIKNSLGELGVIDIGTKLSGNLADSEKGNSNLILIGYPTNELIEELMENHKKLGFFAYFENNNIIILNSKGDKMERSDGALIVATQNPWNPRGVGAFENVVWIISGTDEKEIKHAAAILSDRHKSLRNYFGAFIHDEEIISLPYT